MLALFNTRLLITIGIIFTIGLMYYFLHVKPINDLEEQVEQQSFILDKAKEKTLEQNIKSKNFTDKWKALKESKQKGKEDEKSEDINISTVPGNYAITL